MPPPPQGRSGKKADEEIVQPVTPAFQSRRTLANHVKDIMNCAGRNSFFQRIIFVAEHKETTVDAIKKTYMQLFKQTNQIVNDVKLSGLMIIFQTHSVLMVEGTEDVIGIFLKKVADVADETFKKSKVVLVYNNANQRFFRKIIYRYAEIPNSIDPIDLNDFDVMELQTALMIKKVYQLSQIVHDEEADDTIPFKSIYLGTEHSKWLPDNKHLDYVLNIPKLISLKEYGSAYGTLPLISKYKEVVWPLPFDFVPNNVFDWEKYDINLTFGNKYK